MVVFELTTSAICDSPLQVETKTWVGGNLDIVFNMPLPRVVVVLTQYGAQAMADGLKQRLADPSRAKTTDAIFWYASSQSPNPVHLCVCHRNAQP